MNDRHQEHPNRSMLVAFGLGKLPPADVEAVESHLSECPECCDTLQNLAGDTFIDLIRRCGVAESESHTEAAGNRVTEEEAAGEAIADLPPELVNHPRYRIIRLLGRGGMGVVFAAEHRLMSRVVALKVIRPNLINRPEAVLRFRREVQAAAKLSHPNIVTAYDAEQAGELHFLVMEYVEGTALSQVVETSGRLPVGVACEFARQVAEALQHAHVSAMVHRDIKPHNIMVGSDGQVKILDFGIATLVEAPLPTPQYSDAEAGTTTSVQAAGNPLQLARRLTELGTVIGTPDYIAPEQITQPSAADIRSDIYSLGCTLYYLVAGKPPFPEGTTQAKLRAHIQDTPRSLATLSHDVSQEVDEVVKRMMAKEPADRYATPAEVAEALRPFAESPPTQLDGRWSPLRRFAVIATAAAALLCFAFATIIYVKTDRGTLEIKTSERDVQLVLSENGQQLKVIDLRSGSSIERLPSGRYNVEMRGDDNLQLTVWSKPRGAGEFGSPLDYARDGFKLSRGDHVLARVERKPEMPSVAASEASQPPPTDRRPRDGTVARLRLDVQPTDAIPIALHDSGFEERALADGDFHPHVSHWAIEPAESGAAGVQDPRDEDFVGATDGGDATTIPDGDNVAYCGGTAQVERSAISQILSNRLEANTRYIVHVAVGRRRSGNWPKYKVQLRAGGVVLAEDDNSLSPAPGQFVTSIVNHVTGTEDSQSGQPLEICLLAYDARDQSSSAQVQFDRVQIYSRPAASPDDQPSISLYWFGLAGIRGYVIQRGQGRRTGPFSPIATLDGDITSFVDTDPALESGTTYYYRVLSQESRSIRSGPVGVTTLSHGK